MELSDLLRDAVVGFSIGFGIGTSGICDKRKEQLALAEALLSEEELQERKITQEGKGLLLRAERANGWLYPAMGSAFYSLTVPVFLGQNPLEHAGYAVFSAYFGRITGSAVRTLARIKHRKDLKILKGITQDSEHALDYLPEVRKTAIEQALNEIDQRVEQGDDLINDIYSSNGPVRRMYQAITSDPRVYTPHLIAWSLKKFKDVSENALLRGKIRDFYERLPIVSCAVLGEPKKTAVRVYEFDGENLSTFTVQFEKLRRVAHDSTGMSGIESRLSDLTLESKEPWNEDYRTLADKIRTDKEHTVMLAKTLPDMPDEARRILITDSFVLTFERYQREGEK